MTPYYSYLDGAWYYYDSSRHKLKYIWLTAYQSFILYNNYERLHKSH